MRFRGRLVVLGGSLLLSLGTAAACTGATPHVHRSLQPPQPSANVPTSPSGTQGTVSGVIRLVGGPAPGSDHAVAGTVSVYRGDVSGRPMASVHSDAHGSFVISLPPGTYALAATSPRYAVNQPSDLPPCRAREPIVVTRNAATTADVLCEMR